jgi:cellulose synthase operon protein C
VLYRADALLGRSLENQARFEEAREAYLRVIESEHGKQTETAAEAQFRIAESHLKEKNYDLALKEYYKVYAGYDAPRYESAALFQAGRCDASLKNWRGAVQSYRTLLEEFPESEFAEEARSQLKEIEAAFPELKSSRQ